MNNKAAKTKLLLKYIAAGGAIAIISLISPQLPYRLLRAYIKNRKFQKDRLLQDLKRLQKRELLDYKTLPTGELQISLKSAGKKQILRYEIDNMRINRPPKWDKKWRLIVFDIPDRKRAASNALRAKCKELGLYQLQKSIYIYPFPCEAEIEFISSIFNVRDHVLIMNVSDFEGDKKLMKLFQI
ncbi:hypothetical protein A2833_02185 [Candidatus Azambacteria bacterium RIFCSPHIGHO2_01_FULL_44_55]|uniref:Transcriptional repressor PaaX-like central Cas2-like domain-containing protein n=1 Tax=Candidatus Azambacteria bacterium RIFCSPLOWO2_02_FULL_44_14 TaxID=1797306 RepID=A0A1F5CCN8_9BACT|nr:MAG: hypothetical protein A3C78_00340 [Candidatus Azambacteria bacterium RIFCSPHIGHO2_02_FULL_45_18]OGD40408.1 MAG: hypothetical protein A2833_02185 [Candidatus Azambacteria bacterium RIFCSPHIGHO2_01_FULL_44_55]OGD40620.1 MAG: hypothetical protein A3I30_01205 [Candidatus Azambacteria bacterium RIFCSPLOWO2_02_FULL_44_14]OGD49731.1 MAG: hypothetical protein A2608_01525 [Candidatus Azambacteria bacterium RIFOXYD1_FULL_44_10]